MEKETELPSVPQAELKIPRLPSFEMIDEDYERATEAGWINESPKLLAMLNCRERQLLAAEAREAELKDSERMILASSSHWQKLYVETADRMEALERSHKALLEIVLHGSQNLSRTLEVIEAAEKL